MSTDTVPAELIGILSSPSGLDFSIKIERQNNRWSVVTEIVDLSRRGYAGDGATLADAWRTQTQAWHAQEPSDPAGPFTPAQRRKLGLALVVDKEGDGNG